MIQNLATQEQIDNKADKTTTVTHTASTAVGSTTQPVYINSSGVATATSYSLAKSVPSNAVFTDTNTWRGIQNNLTSTSTTDSLAAAQGKALNDKITTINTSLANIGKEFKGTVNSSVAGGGVISSLTLAAGVYAVVADTQTCNNTSSSFFISKSSSANFSTSSTISASGILGGMISCTVRLTQNTTIYARNDSSGLITFSDTSKACFRAYKIASVS